MTKNNDINNAAFSIKEKMLKYISQKYKEIDARGSITQRLRDTFGKFQYLNEFSPELFESTVDEIKLYADSTIGISYIVYSYLTLN